MVGLPPLVHPDSFQLFNSKTPLSKTQLLFWGSQSGRKQRAQCYFSPLLAESSSAPVAQAAPIKAGPALWADTPHVYFPYLPASFQLRGSEDKLKQKKYRLRSEQIKQI